MTSGQPKEHWRHLRPVSRFAEIFFKRAGKKPSDPPTCMNTPSTFVTASIDAEQRKLTVRWPSGITHAFHYVWLRHNARCPAGMPNDTQVKIDLLPDDPESLVVERFEIKNDTLEICWADDQIETTHNLPTLLDSAYDSASRRRRKPTPVLWHADNTGEIPVYLFSDLNNLETILHIALSVRDLGIARLKGVPMAPGTVATVAENFGSVHLNNYGQVFDVRTGTNLTLGSNTGKFLGPHTDESYRHAAPGITLFHCLTASLDDGGETILVDGFKAAQVLRESDPASFDILCRVPIFFQRRSLPEEDMQSHRRIIALDIDGDVEGIRFTDRTIPPQNLPEELMEPTYKAIKAFWNVVNSEALKFVRLMAPGDLHLFDNQRVLHGRTAFDPTAGVRHLQQCSVNRDEFHNTLRTLAARFNHSAQSLTMAGGALG